MSGQLISGGGFGGVESEAETQYGGVSYQSSSAKSIGWMKMA
jgi:hypothetical protein